MLNDKKEFKKRENNEKILNEEDPKTLFLTLNSIIFLLKPNYNKIPLKNLFFSVIFCM